jgi:recombination associated protein RdgC
MWFKNLALYRFTEPFRAMAAELEARLAHHPARAPGSLELTTIGWVPPLGRSGQQLVHTTSGQMMVCARKEERLLPAAVVREVMDERIAEIEEGELRRVSRKERDAMREEIVLDLMPKAFTRSRLTHAYLDPQDGWLIVDAASRKGAEELVVLLRQSLDTLPVTPPAPSLSPVAVLTQWLGGEALPSDFVLEDECELKHPSEAGGIVRCRRQDLESSEIRVHLEAGKQAVKVALTWNDRLSCVLTDQLEVKRLRFLDLVQEEAQDVAAEDPAARFDADFAIMGGELRRFLGRLAEVFEVPPVAAHRPRAAGGAL